MLLAAAVWITRVVDGKTVLRKVVEVVTRLGRRADATHRSVGHHWTVALLGRTLRVVLQTEWLLRLHELVGVKVVGFKASTVVLLRIIHLLLLLLCPILVRVRMTGMVMAVQI